MLVIPNHLSSGGKENNTASRARHRAVEKFSGAVPDLSVFTFE